MKTAIITGASSGLGREFARQLTDIFPEIECCWLIARREDRLEEIAREMVGVETVCLPLDLCDSMSFTTLQEKLAAEKPEVAILINNAGISGPTALVVENREGRKEYTPEDFSKVLATNLTGTFMFCQEAARQMIKQNATNGKKGGKIIITASVGGFIGGKGVVGYGASKAGCLSLARTLANNFGRENITVNCICPGYVVTPLNEEFFIDKDGNPTDYYKQQSKATSVRRLGTIEEIAGPVLAMCSDSFNYMTGTYLLCDGGQSIPAE